MNGFDVRQLLVGVDETDFFIETSKLSTADGRSVVFVRVILEQQAIFEF